MAAFLRESAWPPTIVCTILWRNKKGKAETLPYKMMFGVIISMLLVRMQPVSH
jgi:hypothetical protein